MTGPQRPTTTKTTGRALAAKKQTDTNDVAHLAQHGLDAIGNTIGNDNTTTVITLCETAVVHHLQRSMEPDTNGRDASAHVVAAGILIDKLRLLRGQPTSLSASMRVSVTGDSLERLAELAQRAISQPIQEPISVSSSDT